VSHRDVLIVEDDTDLRDALADTLMLAGYHVKVAANGNMALNILESDHIEMIVSDVQMDGMNGHTLLRRARHKYPDIPFVLMTAFGTIARAVEAMHDGAVDYLVKPFEAEVLVNMVSRYLVSVEDVDSDLIAEDLKTQEVLKLILRVAGSSATVLINGESGTGKEVFARAIHNRSSRAASPFVAINCAAIPENMLEAMLFGYEKGAFTGAYKASPGKFEIANGGTILLDEISEMDTRLQGKLLRVLQEREVERLGGNKLIPLDIRILATSNRDIKMEVVAGRFREDLYYRLNVFPINLPPLRERKDDIMPILRHLLRRHLKNSGKPMPEISAGAELKLIAHSWPGNVRELDNVVQRALILCQDAQIYVEDIMLEDVDGLVEDDREMVTSRKATDGSTSRASTTVSEAAELAGTLGENIQTQEFMIILQVLKSVEGSRRHAAEKLGISQRTLRYKLARMRDSGMAIPT